MFSAHNRLSTQLGNALPTARSSPSRIGSTMVGADTIIVLDRGRIRARGTHTELLERDEL